MTGALAAVQAKLPGSLGEADLLIGTSAGSMLAAALRCGLGVDELVAHQRGAPSSVLGTLCEPHLDCGTCPPWPSWRVGSPRLVLKALCPPWQVHPWVTAAACLPQGRAEHTMLRTVVSGLLAQDRQRATRHRPAGPGGSPARPPGDAGGSGDGRHRPPALHPAMGWTASGRTWITAVDYDSGRRVVFGRGDAPPATLPDAVAASCSVPAWYRPTVIGGHRYVDGGVHSGTNADLLAAATGLEQAYVLAPAASLDTDSPRGVSERCERYIRRKMTQALLSEVALLRDSGIRITVLTPGPEDLAVMGGNLMDNHRREAVFETSLRTSAAALRGKESGRRAPWPPQRAAG
jgi:NTE family protein